MKCKKEGCVKDAATNRKGFCLSHYQVAMRNANNRPCSLEGCDRPHFAKGYCQRHYDNNKRHGSPYPTRPYVRKAKTGGVA